MKVAKLSGDLGIRTLDLQADIGELATRVTQQARTIEAISGAAAQLSQDGERVSLAGQDAREKAVAARAIIDDSGRQLSAANMNFVDLIEQANRLLRRVARNPHVDDLYPMAELIFQQHFKKVGVGFLILYSPAIDAGISGYQNSLGVGGLFRAWQKLITKTNTIYQGMLSANGYLLIRLQSP